MRFNRAYSFALLLGAMLAAASAGGAPLASADLHVSEGLKAYKEGNLKAAEGELRKAINLKPDSLEAHYYLGRISILEKDWYTAFYALKEVLALQKDYKNSQALFNQLRTPLLEQVKTELKVNPRSARAYNILGFLFVYEHRPSEGITQLEYALKFDPSLATAYDDLAWAYYQANRFDTALKYSERAFTLDPVRASITRHYQQLFYLKRLGFAPDQAGPERFYGGADTARAPSQPAPAAAGRGQAAAALPVPPPAERTSPAAPEPVPSDTTSSSNPHSARQPAVTAQPSGQDVASVATPDLTRINIDDTAIVNAFLKDYKPKPAAQLPPASGPAAATASKESQPKEPPPSAAEIAARVRALYKKGKDLADKTDFEGAQQAFELLVQIDPAYRDARQQLERMRRYARTKRAFEQAMDYYQNGSFPAALEMLRGIDLPTLREFRTVPTLDHLLGECYFRSGRYSDAIEKLARFCEENPQDVKFRYLLAKCYGEQREYHKALDELANIRANDPAYLGQFPEAKGLRMKLTIKAYFPMVALMAAIWALLSAGYFFYKVRQTRDARALRAALMSASQAQKEGDWNKLLETCEHYEQKSGGAKTADVRVRQSKALALVQLGRLDAAQAEVEALPDDGKRQLLRAKIRLETNDVSPEALPEYRFLLNAEPNNLKLLQTMNQVVQAQGASGDEPERILTRLMELEPLKSEYVSQLAGLYLAKNSYDASAQKVFQKLLQEDPANGPARYGLARCHYETSHFVEAIREAKAVVEYDIDSEKVHHILVESYKALGMVEEGEREYRRLLSGHPGNRTLMDALAQLGQERHGPEGPVSEAELKEAYERGMKLFAEGRFAEAMGPLSAAFEGNYQRACSGALMVRGYLRSNEPGTAMRVFERMDVFDQPPDEFLLALCYEMAALYQGEGKTKEAMRLYNFICRNNVNYRDAFQKLEALQAAR